MTKSTGKRDIKRIFYSGDVSIENGGYFYALHTWKWDYVDVVRVVPCSDMDGPDNLFYVEKLTLNIRKGDALKRVISGLYDGEPLPTGAARRHALVDCHLMACAFDQHDSELIQLGAEVDPIWSHGGKTLAHWNSRAAAEVRVIRGNTSIYRYARSVLRDAL